MYQSILIADELRDYLPLLCRFASGERCGLRAEKLIHKGHHAIYSLRANQSTRLLYIIAKVNDVKTVIVLGEVLSHDYHKSRFLRASGALKAYLEKYQSIINSNLQDDAFEPMFQVVSDTQDEFVEQITQEYYPLKAFGTQLFFEDANQEASFKNTHAKTVMISGSSGTGKTVSAMLYLQSHAGALRPDGSLQKFLYVSASPFLVDDVKKQMKAALPVDKLAAIEFKTYMDLVHEERARLHKNTQWVERKTVLEFITNCFNKVKKNWPLFGGVDNIQDATQVVHDEWILLAGLDGSIDEYLQLGDDQSYIKKENKDTRKLIHTWFKTFQDKLKDIEVYLPFHGLSNTASRYDGLIIDEAFLLSFANAQSLSQRADFKMLLGDSHQAIGAHWLSVFTSRQKDGVSHIPLRANFRNPSTVIDALNRVLQVKYFIRPGLRDKYEQGHINRRKMDTDNPIRWIDDDWCNNNQDVIRNWTSSTQFAVMMLCDEAMLSTHEIEAKKEALRHRFGTPLIFTRREIQGLEYPVVTVVIDSTIELINNTLRRGFAIELSKQKSTVPTNRGEEKGVTFNAQRAMDVSSQLYVGFSRAQAQLVVYVDDKTRQKATELLSFYQGGVKAPSEQATAPQEIRLESSETSWAEEQERQKKLGNITIADSIAKTRQTLKRQKEPSAMASAGPRVQSAKLTANQKYTSPLANHEEARELQAHIDADSLLIEPEAYSLSEKWKKNLVLYKSAQKINQENIELICNTSNINVINWVLFGAEVEPGQGNPIYIRYLEEKKIHYFILGIESYYTKILPQGMNHLLTRGPMQNASFAYFMCATDAGQRILKKNADWFGKISKKSLNAILTDSAKALAGTSAVFYLCSDMGKQQLLKDHPEWFDKFDANALNQILPESTGFNAGKSAVFFLCATTYGIELLKDHPEWFDKFDARALNNILPKSAGVDAGTSAASYFCSTLVGLELLEKHPEWFDKFDANALNQILPSSAGSEAGTSAASFLCATTKGRELLKANPKWFDKFDAKALNTILPHSTGAGAGTSAVYYLCSTPSGQELLKTHPNWFDKFNTTALNHVLPESAGAEQGLSAVYFLCSTLGGQKLLQANPQWFDKFDASTLNKALPKSAGADAGKSAASFLCETANGRELLKANPEWLSKFDDATLNTPIVYCPGKSSKLTIKEFLKEDIQEVGIFDWIEQKKQMVISMSVASMNFFANHKASKAKTSDCTTSNHLKEQA